MTEWGPHSVYARSRNWRTAELARSARLDESSGGGGSTAAPTRKGVMGLEKAAWRDLVMVGSYMRSEFRLA